MLLAYLLNTQSIKSFYDLEDKLVEFRFKDYMFGKL